MTIEFWNRDPQGNVIPQEITIDSTNPLLNEAIRKREIEREKIRSLEDKRPLEDKEKDKVAVLNGTIAQLEALKESEKKEIKIKITPLLNYELVNIRNGLGCEGQEEKDVFADICAKHCLVPSHS